jgi:transposase
MQICSVGIDLGKTTFHLVALGAAGKVLVRKKFTQRQLLTYTANMPASLVGLEACSGAHFLGRERRKQGHDVRLIAAQFVKPFVKSNKNDFVDAEAIAEAIERKNMRFVPIKTDDQLDLQAIHRVRDRLITRRTAVINQLRAFLLERGMIFAKTPVKLRIENARSSGGRGQRTDAADAQPHRRALGESGRRSSNRSKGSVTSLSGLPPRTLVASASRRSRASARSLLPPSSPRSVTAPPFARAGSSRHRRQGAPSGHKQARKHLPAEDFDPWRRSRCASYQAGPGPIGAWMDALERRAHRNVLIVAMANKLARIAWAVLSSGEEYRACAAKAAA